METRLPDDLTAEDAQQWLLGTVFYGVNGKGDHTLYRYDRLVARVVAPNDTNRAPYMIRARPLGSDKARVDLHTTDIRLVWPKLGSLNLEGFAVYLQQEPARQWRRGFQTSILRMIVPMAGAVREQFGRITADHLMMNDSYLKQIFTPLYPTAGDALAALQNLEVLSVAISLRIILGLTSDPDKVKVFYRGEAVGHYSVRSRTFEPNLNGGPVSHKIIKKLGDV